MAKLSELAGCAYWRGREGGRGLFGVFERALWVVRGEGRLVLEVGEEERNVGFDWHRLCIAICRSLKRERKQPCFRSQKGATKSDPVKRHVPQRSCVALSFAFRSCHSSWISVP